MGLRRMTAAVQAAAETMAREKIAGGQDRSSVIADVGRWLVATGWKPGPAAKRAAMVVASELRKRKAFETWKEKVAAYADKHVATGDLFDEGDPYDIKGAFDPEAAWKVGKTPSAYVREVFEEDFAMMAYDRELARGG